MLPHRELQPDKSRTGSHKRMNMSISTITMPPAYAGGWLRCPVQSLLRIRLALTLPYTKHFSHIWYHSTRRAHPNLNTTVSRLLYQLFQERVEYHVFTFPGCAYGLFFNQMQDGSTAAQRAPVGGEICCAPVRLAPQEPLSKFACLLFSLHDTQGWGAGSNLLSLGLFH